VKKYKTGQEDFWAGEFGSQYINRNFDTKIIAGNLNLFSKIISKTYKINTLIEFGANIGQNLIAIKNLVPDCKITAVEINVTASKELKKYKWINVKNESLLDYQSKIKFDFVLTKGVLIHMNPEALNKVYKKLYKSCNRYICIVEYYNPSPVEINYRGYSSRLFKRDFAGELLNKYNDLVLVDYGFSYHLDPNFPQDDLNWFLLEKKGESK